MCLASIYFCSSSSCGEKKDEVPEVDIFINQQLGGICVWVFKKNKIPPSNS